jgi:hypothetical protein
MKFIMEEQRSINMAHPTGKWAEAEIRRDDIKDLMGKTKQLATMYSDLLKIKREGWENVLKAQLKKDAKEKEKQNG